MTEFLLYLYAESPVHTGAADSADGLDLPVQREAATRYPVIWGQSLKGALRQAATEAWRDDPVRVTAVFGSSVEDQDQQGDTTPGTLAVGDAQLVAMPVPTLHSTFAWVTTDIVLGRLTRKYSVLNRAAHPVPEIAEDAGCAASVGWTRAASEVLGPCLVQLGEAADDDLTAWAKLLAAHAVGNDAGFVPFAKKLGTDLIMVGSAIAPTLFRECTEQAVRVQLASDSKTVKNGPFYSEYLPAETILAAALTLRGDGDTQANRAAISGLLDKQLLRIGGDETLGKGLMWGRLLNSEA
ncbi:MAG TPA: type III-B CRISPR module RAMP protein Cmr4, partial [Streptosporangiaceae bacterium]|nr:type III-B CRISPR module RAMP protein Cmr4 [Streptosporangiaceae bacterium]